MRNRGVLLRAILCRHEQISVSLSRRELVWCHQVGALALLHPLTPWMGNCKRQNTNYASNGSRRYDGDRLAFMLQLEIHPSRLD